MKDVSLSTQHPVPDLDDFAASFQRDMGQRLGELKLREAALQKRREEIDARAKAEQMAAVAEVARIRQAGDAAVMELNTQRRTVAQQKREIAELQTRLERAETDLRQFRAGADELRAAAQHRIRAVEGFASDLKQRLARAQNHGQLATGLLAKERRAFQGWLAQHRQLAATLQRERTQLRARETAAQEEARAQLRGAQNETFKLRERLAQLEARLKESDEHGRALTAELRHGRQALQTELVQLKGELRAAREHQAQLQQQSVTLQSELQKGRESTSQFQGQNFALQSELQRARDLVTQLQLQNLALQNEAKQSRDSAAQAQSQNLATHAQLQQVRQDLQMHLQQKSMSDLLTQFKAEMTERTSASSAEPEWDAAAAERRLELADDLAAGPEAFFAKAHPVPRE